MARLNQYNLLPVYMHNSNTPRNFVLLASNSGTTYTSGTTFYQTLWIACDIIGRHFLNISTYLRTRTAILRGNEQGSCTAKPILQAYFEIRSMHLASTFY